MRREKPLLRIVLVLLFSFLRTETMYLYKTWATICSYVYKMRSINISYLRKIRSMTLLSTSQVGAYRSSLSGLQPTNVFNFRSFVLIELATKHFKQMFSLIKLQSTLRAWLFYEKLDWMQCSFFFTDPELFHMSSLLKFLNFSGNCFSHTSSYISIAMVHYPASALDR